MFSMGKKLKTFKIDVDMRKNAKVSKGREKKKRRKREN